MLEIDDKGIRIERMDDIILRLSAEYREIYGSDINLDPETPDGQWIGIQAQREMEMQEAFAGLYMMSDPAKAKGVFLDIQAKYAGIYRNRPTRSLLYDVQFNTDIGVNTPKGLILLDKNQRQWRTILPIKTTSTQTLAMLESVEFGAHQLPSGEILKPQRVILGVHSVLTTKQSTLGKNQEKDSEFYARLLRSYHVNNCHDAEGIVASILKLNDVSDAKVYENYTGELDSKGVNPHTTNYIILGGDDVEIANTIISKKTAGTGLQGNTPVTIFYKESDRVITFDRPARIDVSVNIRVRKSSAVVDVDQNAIKEAIASKKFLIAEDVVGGELYCVAGGDSYKIVSIKLSSGDLTDVDEIPVGLRSYAVILKENVNVSVE